MSTIGKLTQDVTTLIKRSESGDGKALEELAGLIYPDLKRIAGSLLSKRVGHFTISPTALVHDVFIKHFLEDRNLSSNDRVHLLSMMARAMRWSLGKMTRTKMTNKRGGGAFHLELSEVEMGQESKCLDFMILDQLLEELENTNGRVFQVAQLKIFIGLENQEIAKALDISLTTVKRDWEFGKAWLKRQMSNEKKTG